MSLEEQMQELNSSIKELIKIMQGISIKDNIDNVEKATGVKRGTFTMEEAAAYLGVGYSTLSIKKDEWGIPYTINGTRKLFTKSSLDEFLKRREQEVLNEDEYTKYLKKELKRVK